MLNSISKATTIVILLATLASCTLPTPPGAPEPTAAAGAVATPPPTNQVIADALVVPVRQIELAFEASGTVAEVLVNEGDLVQAGTPLARLDTRDLALQVAQRKASLAQAQASYNRIEAGATPAEVAAQQALVRNAQAQLERTRSGNTTAPDIAGGQAQLRAAQARLAALKNPSPATLSAAQLSVTQAQNNLATARTNTSASKTNAELAMQQAADSLTQAQASYATARQNWEYVQETGADPTNPNTIDPKTGQKTKNRLNDVQQRQYYQAFVQAEAAMHSAEKALAQAQVSYDTARQDEVTRIQQAEASLADAQQQLEALKNPAPSDIAQAQASVDQASASLQKLRQGGSQAEVAAAQASLDQAQATLDGLTVPPRAVDLAEAQAGIEAATVALQQAERQLEAATLVAPFAGTIAQRQLEVGQQVGTGSVPFILADFAAWQIKTDNLSERDVVRLAIGAPAQISFEALPDLVLPGKVSAIQPRGVDRFGDITYTVTITPNSWDDRLRWNMSATVAIGQ